MTTAQRSTGVVLKLLEEGRQAEACLFLFHLHKYHIEEWQQVQNKLMLQRWSSRELSVLATVMKCSAHSDLSSCDSLIPGLCQYSRRPEPLELFD